jgi:hypothetical protein
LPGRDEIASEATAVLICLVEGPACPESDLSFSATPTCWSPLSTATKPTAPLIGSHRIRSVFALEIILDSVK